MPKSTIKPEELAKAEQILKEMIDFGEIYYGIITDGLCSTPEAQEQFDKTQKNKPPAVD